MLDFPRWKVIGIWALLALGVLLSVPSLLPRDIAHRMPAWVQKIHVNLGLDLAGGSHLLLEAQTGDVARQRVEMMEDNIRRAMRTASPQIEIGDVSTQNGQLAFAVRDPARVNDALGLARQQAQPSSFGGTREWDVSANGATIVMRPTQAGLDSAVSSAMESARDVIDRRINALGTLEPTIIRQGSNRILVQVPGLQNPEALKQLIGRTARLEFRMVDENATPQQIQSGRAPIGSQILPLAQGGRIAVQRRAIITGDMISDARQAFDQQDGSPNVVLTFDSNGARRFAHTTQENVGKPFAIILDNVVLSYPVIREPILGGTASISGGGFTVETANQLAISLRSGRLPVELNVIEERTVGPDLGADSIRAGIIACIVATVAVLIFMFLSYGRFGLYADLAVIINLFVIVGIMALLNATLTLPGIAGFVLTVGTAVDANVLIDERIREERRRGRSVLMAVENGYKEASRTIFEANVVHTIAGLIMLVLGTGPIKGFAIVLLIGIATSVFTAVVFTRMLVAGWIRRNRPTEINI
ncbi:protein translocase subunit SecD [Sphingosinicella ginsenosidimutans]|uniref:Protein translocase subunit SecD n=1 Tax=Allosphingosinicella ginsenosidimutans TaxID=1176539 RepID=A0A5C6TRB7_9SPHN|nr:protein translocase subunit SecD [Sphingosinicella ginsenosidimutans]TXC62883.1 protein translocase subunit SecD [Sphingosinicella ginsenosidimutans]